jgi:hypothetical protein
MKPSSTPNIHRSPEIFTVDRTITIPESMVWMALTGANQIKLETIDIPLTIEKVPADEKSLLAFKGKIPKTADLLYGIRFSVSVLNFTLHLLAHDGAVLSEILNFIGSGRAVKEVRFEKPVPLIPYFTLEFSYNANPRENISEKSDVDFFKNYKIMHPVLTLGLLTNDGRHELHDSLLRKSFHPIEDDEAEPIKHEPIEDIEKTKPTSVMTTSYLPFSIKPIVILRNGSIYDKNIINIIL